jgi:hypothetical protein
MGRQVVRANQPSHRLTLSLLKQHPGKGSIAMKRRACGWSDKFLLEVLTGIVP